MFWIQCAIALAIAAGSFTGGWQVRALRRALYRPSPFQAYGAQYALGWLTSSPTQSDRLASDAQLLSPLIESQILPVVLDSHSIAFVALLLRGCRPSAIPMGVWAIILSSLKSGINWPRTHVAQECFKGINPFIADSNSARTIVFIILVRRNKTSSFHVLPT